MSLESVVITGRTRIFLPIAGVVLAAVGTPMNAQCVGDPLTPPPDGGDFGVHTAVLGARGLVGAWRNQGRGAVIAFERDGSGAWVQSQRLEASNGAAGDGFGVRLAMMPGATAIVGAHLADDKGTDSGAVYVFRHDGNQWVERAKLTPSDGAAGDQFGWWVDADGERFIAGAWRESASAGTAYVYTGDGSDWTVAGKLRPSRNGANYLFGHSVAIDGDAALVGAPGEDSNAGAAYLFEFDGTHWIETARFVAADRAQDDQFGVCVDLADDTAVIGAWGDDDGRGSAWVFTRDGDEWDGQRLRASDGNAADRFGMPVVLGAERLVIGARRDSDTESESGAVYLFAPQNGLWNEVRKLTAPEPEPNGEFGVSASLDDETMLVGAWTTNGGQGAAYAFPVESCPPCAADLTGDGVVDSLDFLLLLGAWAQGDPIADWNQDGTIDTLDFLAYLNDWVDGC